ERLARTPEKNRHLPDGGKGEDVRLESQRPGLDAADPCGEERDFSVAERPVDDGLAGGREARRLDRFVGAAYLVKSRERGGFGPEKDRSEDGTERKGGCDPEREPRSRSPLPQRPFGAGRRFFEMIANHRQIPREIARGGKPAARILGKTALDEPPQRRRSRG